MNMADCLINSVYQFSNQEVKEEHIEIVKRCILDYLAAVFAGSRLMDEKNKPLLNSYVDDLGQYTVVGTGKKTSFYNAVFLNGFNSHIAELDDGHRYAALHPGTPIISALLSLLENRQISARDFIKGIIIGYEVAIVLGASIQPYHKQQGFHATGTCGTIGAAMAVGAAMGFSREQMKSALSAAVTSASGVLEVIDDSSELKPFNIGMAALNGLVAALTGSSGLLGPEDILGGKRGFFSTMGDPRRFRLEKQPFTEPLMIEGIYLKLYAACRHCHPAIEAAIYLKEIYNLDHKLITSILVETYDLAVFGHDHWDVKGISSAKMSTPFGVALALKYGRAGIEEFTEENIKDRDLLCLAQMVKIISSDELSILVPNRRAAIVEIQTASGGIFKHRVDYPKGEPENPLTSEELQEKFTVLANFGGISAKRSKQIKEFVSDFDKIVDVESFFKLLS